MIRPTHDNDEASYCHYIGLVRPFDLRSWLPKGERVDRFDRAPSDQREILYVATNDAVYKSRDGGGTWERFPSFSARRVTTLAIAPLLPATIYAGTMGDAVYKSTDGGQHWLPHNVGLKEHVSFVNQFVFHPALSEKIYIGTTVGAFHTQDAGREWEEGMNGMKEVHIVNVHCHQSQRSQHPVWGHDGRHVSLGRWGDVVEKDQQWADSGE